MVLYSKFIQMITPIIYFVISYKFKCNIEPNHTKIVLPFNFRFKKGGNYSIHIFNGGNDDFILFIKQNQYLYYYLNKNEINIACSNYTIANHENIHVIHMNNGSYNLSGLIDKGSVYKTTIKSCSNNHEGFSIEAIYMNSNSPFSYDAEKALKSYLLLSFIYGIIFLIWIINLFPYFSIKNPLHLIITSTLVTFLLSYIINCIKIKEKYESNKTTIASKISFLIGRLRDFLYYTTLFIF